jgi:arsenate reductase (thioredoxin)
MKKRVLFVCTHNSARSQIAEGLLRMRFGDRYDVASAGTSPSSVHSMASKVMAEAGIDISRQQSKHFDTFLGESFDWVVTVCDHAKSSCPFFPGGSRYVHAGFADPSLEEDYEKRLAAFRQTRDRMDAWIQTSFGGQGEPFGAPRGKDSEDSEA